MTFCLPLFPFLWQVCKVKSDKDSIQQQHLLQRQPVQIQVRWFSSKFSQERTKLFYDQWNSDSKSWVVWVKKSREKKVEAHERRSCRIEGVTAWEKIRNQFQTLKRFDANLLTVHQRSILLKLEIQIINFSHLHHCITKLHDRNSRIWTTFTQTWDFFVLHVEESTQSAHSTFKFVFLSLCILTCIQLCFCDLLTL